MRSKLLVAAIAVVGCSQAPSDPPSAVATVADVSVTSGTMPTKPETSSATPISATAPAATPQPSKPPEPPTVFEYPSDLGGKVVLHVVAPPPPKFPSERLGADPKPHIVPVRMIDPDPVSRADTSLPPIPVPKPNEVLPTPPAERVPLDLGALADAVPEKPTFPIAAGITTRARDVNLPPPLPILGRPYSERVSLEDPTIEFAHGAITVPPVKVSMPPAGFVKVTVPDPFELGEQVKPMVPATAEPGLAPVVVNPQRVK